MTPGGLLNARPRSGDNVTDPHKVTERPNSGKPVPLDRHPDGSMDRPFWRRDSETLSRLSNPVCDDGRPAQLSLALDFAPEPVRDHGLRAAHLRPLVSLGKRAGRPFVSFRVPPERAWQYPELEYGNAGSSFAALVLDCDRPKAWRVGVCDLPPYSWLVLRPANDHAHIVWCLAEPVHRYPAARIDPLRYLAGIAEYYAHAVGADPAYSGVLAHNPAPLFKGPYRTTWGREAALHPRTSSRTVIPFNWDAAYRPADKRGPQRRSIRGRDAMGWSSSECQPAGAASATCRQPEISPTCCHCLRCRRWRAPLRNTASGGPRAVGIVLAGYRGKRHVGGAAAKLDTWGATSH